MYNMMIFIVPLRGVGNSVFGGGGRVWVREREEQQ